MAIRYLTQKAAQQIDQELMSDAGGFKLEQLMELAGLACAQALAKVYAPQSHRNVLVCAGPGNQGGDGLVAARHLVHFGYQPTLFYPKEGKNEFYQALKRQCLNLSIAQISKDQLKTVLNESDVVLDAIFGFSFSGEVRDPFKEVIAALKQTRKPIVSVDIPSAWDVEKGNIDNRSFTPDVLVSLTAPKMGSKGFKGTHFLGGRFIPPEVAARFDLNLPDFPGTEQITDITPLAIDLPKVNLELDQMCQ